jgi:hypothetical protein
VKKHKKFDGIANTNTDVKRMIHIRIYQIADEIKNKK